MNKPPTGIQDFIHSLESGPLQFFLRAVLVTLGILAATGAYLMFEARNFSNPEAMDMAQLGRNLAEGRGYTTRFIRPMSFQLIRERLKEREEAASQILLRDHPDLQNPPVHPMMVAVLFKVLPDRFVSGLPADVNRMRPWGEVVITGLNLFWFGVGTVLLYRLGRRLFDAWVGGLAAATYAGTELMWQFCSNGLPTPFLIVLVILLAGLLARLDETGAELAPGVVPPFWAPVRLAMLAGLVLGIGFLTRYSFAWLAVPAVIWMLVTHVRRWSVVTACLLTLLVVSAPWMARNYHLSGRFLGTASSALTSGTLTFPAAQQERLLQPPKTSPNLTELRVKLAVNGSELLREAVPKLGGNWLSFLFFAGLLLPFRNPVLRRLRWFAAGSLVMMFLVEALGRTHASELVPGVNGENQLVLLTPLAFLFGAALFFSLLESTELGHPLFQKLFVGGAWLVFSLPFLTSLLPPRTYPTVEPTYRPAIIQEITRYIQPTELMMSDIPWAVAWYGNRDCMWLPLAARDPGGEDFFAVNDFERRVSAIYLSPLTSEAPLRQVAEGTEIWALFYFDALMRRNLPTGFPLLHAYEGSARSGHFFLADRRRW
jgi:hypothetical protein